MMMRLKLIGLTAALAIVSTAAFAFQEQQQAAPATQSEQAAQPNVAPVAPDAPPTSKGMPVRIPGLGTLGMIPKMDFGLELLYGAAEQAKRSDPSKPENDDVLVGGRIKHKF
jgi:hypothetical protein